MESFWPAPHWCALKVSPFFKFPDSSPFSDDYKFGQSTYWQFYSSSSFKKLINFVVCYVQLHYSFYFARCLLLRRSFYYRDNFWVLCWCKILSRCIIYRWHQFVLLVSFRLGLVKILNEVHLKQGKNRIALWPFEMGKTST